MVVFAEDHLRRLLREYVQYYNTDRVHTVIADAPAGRMPEVKSASEATVIRLPRVGGLHGRCTWRKAALARGWILRTDNGLDKASSELDNKQARH